MESGQNTQAVLMHLVQSAREGQISCDFLAETVKKQYYLIVLNGNNLNECKSARELGIHRNTLIRNMKQMGINIQAMRAARKASAVR